MQDALSSETHRKCELEARSERKRNTDNEIAKLISEDGGDGELSSFLDVLQSPKPEIVSLLRLRQSANNAESQAREAATQAAKFVEFRRSLQELLDASKEIVKKASQLLRCCTRKPLAALA